MAILKAPNNSSPQTYVIGSGNIGVNAGDTLKIEFIVNSVSPTLTRLTLNVYDSDDLLIASITGEDKYAEVQTTGQRGLNSYFSGTYDDVIFSSRETSFDTSPLNFYSDRNTVKFGNSVQFTVSSLDDMVVNLSDNGAGGTFSPSQTVTLTAENTHSTNITYTPATLGNVVISASETSNLVERPLFVSPYSPVMGFIGDSMTALIPNRGKGAVSTAIFQLGAGFLELNNGQNGATTQTRLTSLSDYLINSYKNQNVGIVSIMLGTNDAADSSITPEIYKSNLQSIIDTLWSANVQKIILNESPYNNKVTPEQLEEMEAYRRILDELSDGKKVLRGDTQAYEQIRDLALFGPDQLHPNITGWKMLGELRANAYKTLLIDPYITPSHIFSTGSYYTGDTALIHTTMIDTRAFAHYVTLDGTPLEEEVDYTFTGNEKTEITLLTGYLDTLQTGSYTLTVYFLGTGELGTVEISDIFEVKAVVEETPTPPIVTPPTVPATPSYV
jgi:lysophospholipase L1-like esterase